MIEEKIDKAKQMGLIPQHEAIEPKLSTKDRLKQMGINVGFTDDISLGSDTLSTGYDDFNVDHLDSEEDD